MPSKTVNMEQLLRATAKAEARHFWFRGFKAFVTPLLRRACDRQERDFARLLDCGCGTGANLQMLDRFGRSYGFDVSTVGLRIGYETGRTRLTRASVTAVPFSNGVFDVVTSFDVLYSLDESDEQAAIEEMYRVLRPGGFVIVNVAAMEALRGDHSVLSREVRRYTRRRLRERLTAAGFVIVRLTHTNATLFLPMLFARTLQRRRGLSEQPRTSELAVPPAPVNAALTGLLLVESLWLRWFNAPVGSSLLCLAQKPAKEKPARD